MENRQCHRFNPYGTTIYYKKKSLLRDKRGYPDYYHPVLDISRGGMRFLTNERPKIGLPVKIKLTVPDADYEPEINAIIRWVSLTREESYRYQIGVSFNPYGKSKKENPTEVLSFIQSLESLYPPLERL